MTPSATQTSAAPTGKRIKNRGFRPDIEGLRAIAIGSVLVYHAGVPWMTGGFVGVDVFFVISGFLITSLIVREVSRNGRLSLSTFWARRAKRLLPASALVLVFSTIITFLFLPVTDRKPFGGDIISAAVYLVNWRLADREVDYLAENVGMSPVQHYWSLAVEEQFYVVWPLLIALLVVLFRRRWLRAAVITMVLGSAASFGFALYASANTPATAFFVSSTRAWELGVGALLAVTIHRLSKLPGPLLAVVGWLGLAVLVSALFLIDGSTRWPAWATLAPTLGTAALILAGSNPTSWSPGRLLGVGPAVWLGGLSYSLYLWHWPFLIAGQGVIDDFRIRHGIALTVLSFIPAWLSYKYVENPIRHGAAFKINANSLKLGAVMSIVSALAGASLVASVTWGATKQADPQDAIGAAALLDPATADTAWSTITSVDSMTPTPLEAPEDVPQIYTDPRNCTVRQDESVLRECDYGEGDKTLAVVGDSKVLQWTDAFIDIAEKSGWRVVVMSKSACAFGEFTRVDSQGEAENCQTWGRKALDRLLDLEPDLIVTSQRNSTALPPGGTTTDDYTAEAMADGVATYWKRLTDAGLEVSVILDNPAPDTDVFECVAENSDDLAACSFDKAAGIKRSAAPTQRLAREQVPAVEVIDLTDVVCPEADACAPVIGDVLLWRQGSHVTNTYALSAEPQLSDAFARITGGTLGERLKD